VGDLSNEGETEGLQVRRCFVKPVPVPRQGQAECASRIPGLDSGADASEAGSCGGSGGDETGLLHACWTRRADAATSSSASAQPRVDSQSLLDGPKASQESERGRDDLPSGTVSAEELVDQQKKDEDLSIIRAWLEDPKTVPDRNALHAYGPEIQQLWAQRESLEVTQGVLYRST